jgi:hypothetical protein
MAFTERIDGIAVGTTDDFQPVLSGDFLELVKHLIVHSVSQSLDRRMSSQEAVL